MSAICRSATADVLLLYPGESLREQIGLWAFRHSGRRVDVSSERSLPEIRQLLRYADATVVDATQDPAQAIDAFLQAAARLGTGAVTMYTETVHDGLELFVRLRGSLFLLGPLLDRQWEEVFDGMLQAKRPAPRAPASRRPSFAHLQPRGDVPREPHVNRLRRRLD